MAFLKSLINWLKPSNKVINKADPDDHYQRLERLRINHDWIEVKVTKTNKSYQSLVLEIDPDNNELVIDDLYPPEKLENIEPGDTVEITSQLRHALINFYTRILARQIRDGEACYRLELPVEVGHNHSRCAYRIYVESEEGLDIEINHEGEPLLDVRIINLSAEGIKLSFADAIGSKDKNNLSFNHSIIHLPTDYDIDCHIELHKLYRMRSPHLHTLGGGKLIVENPQHRVKLQQYLAAVQRRQRRRENRLS
ncbi:MAG: flagellar regulator YcgR PilZN domain-containing protein [Pseudomonadales bacterium]